MRCIRRGFAVFVLPLSLIIGSFFVRPQQVFAQATTGADKIGTHLIQGDYGAQAEVIKKLITGGVLSQNPSYPIVVMVDTITPEKLQLIKDALGGSSFKVILRVNLPINAAAVDMGGVIAAIRQHFPGANYPVVVGNEINNQEAEWKSTSYANYGTMFNQICSAMKASGNPCGIAALDTINTEYSVIGPGSKGSNLLDAILSRVSKSLVTAIFANVYETGCGQDRCSVRSGQWIASALRSKGVSAADIYITEFGTTKCGDYDCLQEFYEGNNDIAARAVVGFSRVPGEATGANWVHTVPAICEYWLAGPGLQVERPTKCGGGKKKSFIYPGIDDQATADKMRVMAAGYTLMCGNQFKIQGAISGNFDSVPARKRPDCSANPPPSVCVFEGLFANIVLDNTKTKIPLYRFEGAQVPNPDSPKRRLDDLEGFFGAVYTKKALVTAANEARAEEKFLPPLANGVSQKLIGFQAQCEMKVQYLRAIKQLCDEENVRGLKKFNDILDADRPPAPPIVPPAGECALYSNIPGANAGFSTYKKVIDAMPGNFSCQNVDATGPADPHWYDAFSKIELTTPKGFKPAYLVHYIDRPEQQPANTLEHRVNWLAPGEDTSAGVGDERNINDRIKIVKVYVPAGFAETNIKDITQDPNLPGIPNEPQPEFFPTYTGGFMQTISAIMPLELQIRIASTRAYVTKQISDFMGNANIFSLGDNAIVCQTCAAKPDPLDPRRMIIRRINAGIPPVFDTAGKKLVDGLVCDADDRIGEKAVERVHTINPAGTLDPIIPAKITASATLVAKNGDGKQLTVRTYLLLPEEYRNIAEYEQSFLETFLPYAAQDTASHSEYKFITFESEKAANPKASYKYLQLSGSSADVSGPLKTNEFTYTKDPSTPPFPLPPGVTPPPPGNATVTVTGQITADRATSQINPDPQIPGGILARGLWEVMCNVTRPFDNVPTIPYPGFEKFLQEGLDACTKGSKPTTTPTTPIAAGSCNYGDPAIQTAIQNAATKYGVPPEMLLAIFQPEGFDYRLNPAGYTCKENFAAAAGVTQVTRGTYATVTCPDERMENDLASCQTAPAGKMSRCDVNTSFELAARVLLLKAGYWRYGICDGSTRNTRPILATNISDIYKAASNYYGMCRPDSATGNFSRGALARGEILACRGGNCSNMGYGDFVCAYMAKINGLNYCNRPDNFPPCN